MINKNGYVFGYALLMSLVMMLVMSASRLKRSFHLIHLHPRGRKPENHRISVSKNE